MSSERINSASTVAIIQYHKNLIEEHGIETTETPGWMQTEGQRAHFEMLSRMAI